MKYYSILFLFVNAFSAFSQIDSEVTDLQLKLKTIQEELVTLKIKKDIDQKAYVDTLTKLRAEREKLLGEVSTSNGPIPEFITLTKIKALDTEIGALFTTNRFGRLKVVLTDDQNQIRGSRETDFDSKHLVRFQQLSPGTPYTITAFAINAKGEETATKLLPTADSRLKIKTMPIINPPIIHIDKVDPTHNAIGLITSYDKPVAMIVEFFTVDDSTRMEYRTRATLGSITLDEFFCPTDIGTGDKKSSRSFQVNSLAPNRDYYFKIKAVDEHGKIFEDKTFHRARTQQAFPPFEFKEGVDLTFSSLDSKVSWEATSQIKSAQVSFSIPGKQDVIFHASDFKDNKTVIEFNYTQIQQLISNKSKNTTPLVTVSMKNINGIERTIKCRVSFTIPKKEDIKRSNLSPDQKEAITKVSEIAVDGVKKKIDWGDIIKTGLPIILSIL